MIRVAVVDDHPLVRSGLGSLLGGADDIEVTGEAGDGVEAIALAHSTEIDVMLMDVSMPVMDGVVATREVLRVRPEMRVLVLSSFADGARVRQAVEAGARGYVLKDSSAEQLLDAVRSAAAGHSPLDPRVAAALLPQSSTPGVRLSAREVEVLRMASSGLANKQIARTLGIAERTVKVHLGNVFRQLGVRDRTSAALWARDNLPES